MDSDSDQTRKGVLPGLPLRDMRMEDRLEVRQATEAHLPIRQDEVSIDPVRDVQSGVAPVGDLHVPGHVRIDRQETMRSLPAEMAQPRVKCAWCSWKPPVAHKRPYMALAHHVHDEHQDQWVAVQDSLSEIDDYIQAAQELY